MGLAMVHGIVHDHGGHLHLVTSPGAGARFGFWLPMAAPSQDALPSNAPAAPRDAPLRGRVLLVEDDTMVGDFLVERLSNWGLDVRLERAAPDAAAWLDDPANVVDLLVTDQTMPSMTGLQLAERVHAARARLAIVLVSGNATGFDTEELTRCGVVAALSKPIDGDQLRGVLRRLLSATGDAHAVRAER
jgi:DNA-binding NtrC family response regulator